MDKRARSGCSSAAPWGIWKAHPQTQARLWGVIRSDQMNHRTRGHNFPDRLPKSNLAVPQMKGACVRG